MSGSDQASADRAAIARLMRPRSVAIIGASADPTRTAGRPVGYLVKHGYTGGIYPVNPRVKSIDGLACYHDVASLPEAPDVGLVLLGPERAVTAVRDLAARGATGAIVLAGGYGETGEEGAARQRDLKEAAGAMRLVGPNTFGIVNLVDHIMLSATGALEIGDLPAGRISVVSQSGGSLGSLLSRAADRGVGYARVVSTGNEADLDVTAFMDALLDDEETDVISVYLEGLRHPQRFCEVAARAAQIRKPIVVFKVGRSESGARSAVSHTGALAGALAGADGMYDALFRQLGVIRAETFSDLIDVPAALVARRRPKGNRVAILTSTGGAGTIVADGCGLLGLELPDPDETTAKRLAALLDEEQAAATRNPVDVTLAGVKPDVFRAAIMALLESPGYDQLVVVVGSSALANPSLAADAIVECQATSDKPILAYLSPHAPHIVSLLNRQGIPAFAAPKGCSAAASALWRVVLNREASCRRGAGVAPIALPARDVILDPLPKGTLDEAEAKALFARFGIEGARGESKSMLARVRVATGIEPDGLLVQEMVSGGLEMILGLVRDAQLGPAILLGMGGVTAELTGDTAVRLLPITRADAEAMVADLKTAKLLTGYRGSPPRDVPALIDAILSFATLAARLDDCLVEAEINPLFVMPEGQGVKAADGLAVLQ